MQTSTVVSTSQDEMSQSFEVPVRHEAGHCSEPKCPCGNAIIPKGSGYLCISPKVVDFRSDCATPSDLLFRLNKNRADLGYFETFEPDYDALYPRLLCKDAAIRGHLNLDVAAEDAENWWHTGRVPLRATPMSSAS